MQPLITSTKNQQIKTLLSLQKSGQRKKQKLFTIEGIKEIELALKAGYSIHQLFFCPDIFHDKKHSDSVPLSKSLLIPISRKVYEKIAYRKKTGGIIATARWRNMELQDLPLPPVPLLLIIQSIEKPGNIGALLRTADAAGIDAVIVCDSKTDIYNPNVIRSSMGCLFTNQVINTSSKETIVWLKKKHIQIYGASLQGSNSYLRVDYNHPCAIVVGKESTGLDAVWKKKIDENIIIPMHGRIDSINVSVAAGILLFEAIRQRSS